MEAVGLKVWNIGNTSVHNMEEVTLNLPGRDKKIAEYQQFLRNLGRAGIFYTTYAYKGNRIWSTEKEATRGGATIIQQPLTGSTIGNSYDVTFYLTARSDFSRTPV